jgi:YihY family inner membrane protein
MAKAAILLNAVREVLKRAWRAAGTLLSRDIAVLTNAIAFNFLLCLFPLLLVLAAFSLRYQGSRAGAGLLLLLQELIPFGHTEIAASLKNLTKMGRGLEIFALLLIVWGSSGIFMPVEMALNRAWGGKPNRHFLLSRSLAFLMTVAGGFLAFLSVSLTLAVRAYGRDWPTLAGYGAKVSAAVMTIVLFFLIFRLIPSVPVGNRVAIKAALWSGLAWEIAKHAFVAKLGSMNLAAFYGPLAFAVALVLWAYLSSLVLVFGALMVPASRGRP